MQDQRDTNKVPPCQQYLGAFSRLIAALQTNHASVRFLRRMCT